MVPAQVVLGAVAMVANPLAETDHLLDELLTRESFELGIWSRHTTSFAPPKPRGMPV
jgi:hypothetical protein